MYTMWKDKYVTRMIYYNITIFNDTQKVKKTADDCLSHYDTNRSRRLTFLPGDHLSRRIEAGFVMVSATTYTIYDYYLYDIYL